MNIKLTISMMIFLFVRLSSKGQDSIPVIDKRNNITPENVAIGHKDRVVIMLKENTPGVKSKNYCVNM
jgi:hypothetical protein